MDDRADVVAAHDAEWFRERAIEGTFPVCSVDGGGVDFDEYVRGTEGSERDGVYLRLALDGGGYGFHFFVERHC